LRRFTIGISDVALEAPTERKPGSDRILRVAG